MSLQIIRNLRGEDEYALLPVAVYDELRNEIDATLEKLGNSLEDTDLLSPGHYIKNPITLMRMRAGLKQKALAERLNVTQAYISKVENSDRVSDRLLARVREVIQAYALENRKFE